MKIRIEDILNLRQVEYIRNKKIEYMLFIYITEYGFKIDVYQGIVDSLQPPSIEIIKQNYAKYLAKGFITIHNHPSGVCSASVKDAYVHSFYQYQALKHNIKHLDDIIVTKKQYFSFKEIYDDTI